MSLGIKDLNGNAVQLPNYDVAYGFASASLAPGAAPTDIIQLTGAAGVVTRIKRIMLTLQSGTVAGGQTYTLQRRSTAASGGTGNTRVLAKFDNRAGVAAASTVLTDFTAAPTAGTAVGGPIRAAALVSAATAASTAKDTIVWDFTTRMDQAPILNGASDFLCVTQSAVLATGQTLSYEVQVEEGTN